MKLGIYGGSFNPIHNGHLILAESVRDALGLQKVIFVPARIPPHKANQELAGPEHRAAMVRQAMYANPRFVMSDIELQREGPSFTIDTIRALRKEHPGDDFFFIIGADTVSELSLWKEIEVLGQLCTIVTGARPGFSAEVFDSLEGKLPPEFLRSLREHYVETPLIQISSSTIRQRVREGRSIRHLVPPGVLDHIRTCDLYRSIVG
jgi:nicotinate-nucleotide adenylyltransferase